MSNRTRSKQSRKKLIRNILIAVVAVAVIVTAIVLIGKFRKDGHGMNGFEREATAAKADGVRVSMIEYAMTYDVNNGQYASMQLSDDEYRILQEGAAKQALLVKIYEKEAKALGLSLSAEDKAECEKAASDEIASLEKSIEDHLISEGNYSKQAYDKQIASQFEYIGMSRSAYYRFVYDRYASAKYSALLTAYYQENGKGFSEDELQAFYRETVEKTINAENAYEDGQFWQGAMYYAVGLAPTPMLYLPEGFIFIDYVQVKKASAEEAAEFAEKVKSGEESFDDLMKSEDNQDYYKDIMKSPYPIAENDHSALFTSQDIYAAAAALEIGEIGTYVGEPVKAEDGTETVPVYLFRRAEGKICLDGGDSGIIDIDYYTGMREAFEGEYRSGSWFKDLSYSDAIYSYRGIGK